MSEIKALEKLRKYTLCDRGEILTAYFSADEIADEIEAEIADMQTFCERVEKAAESRDELDIFGVSYMALPVDADGVPIHLGDLLVRENDDKHFCHGIGKPSLDVMDEHCNWWRSECFHHVKPRTLEDVLIEYRLKAYNLYLDDEVTGDERVEEFKKLDAEYDSEIRELLGGDE